LESGRGTNISDSLAKTYLPISTEDTPPSPNTIKQGNAMMWLMFPTLPILPGGIPTTTINILFYFVVLNSI
jgi:hypothetical protein